MRKFIIAVAMLAVPALAVAGGARCDFTASDQAGKTYIGHTLIQDVSVVAHSTVEEVILGAAEQLKTKGLRPSEGHKISIDCTESGSRKSRYRVEAWEREKN